MCSYGMGLVVMLEMSGMVYDCDCDAVGGVGRGANCLRRERCGHTWFAEARQLC